MISASHRASLLIRPQVPGLHEALRVGAHHLEELLQFVTPLISLIIWDANLHDIPMLIPMIILDINHFWHHQLY